MQWLNMVHRVPLGTNCTKVLKMDHSIFKIQHRTFVYRRIPSRLSCSNQRLNMPIVSNHLLDSFQGGCAYFQQKRNVSQEFYNKYMSPEFPPVGLAQQTLEGMHDLTGLPWWASIALTTFALRTFITLPLAVYSAVILSKVQGLGPEMLEKAKQLKMEVGLATKKYGWDMTIARNQYIVNFKRIQKELYIRENCHPFKATVVMWIQIPMWISLSFALRNMAGALPVKGMELPVLCPGLETGGVLWFSNLLVPESTFILPILLGLLNLSIIEMNTLTMQNPTRFQKTLTFLLRGVSLIMIPIGASVPSCMCLYWTCSSFYGLLQNIALKSPSVKRMFRIPPVPNESQTPFRDIYQLAKVKYGRKKKTEPQ